MKNIIQKKRFLLDKIEFLLKQADESVKSKEDFEYYLSNNLKKFYENINNASTEKDYYRAIFPFSRFVIDSMDWESKVFKECMEVIGLGRELEGIYKTKNI